MEGQCLDCDEAVLLEAADTRHVAASSEELDTLKVEFATVASMGGGGVVSTPATNAMRSELDSLIAEVQNLKSAEAELLSITRVDSSRKIISDAALSKSFHIH